MIRTKGRRRFDYNGRPFVWFIARDVELRIASVDKRFVVMYELIGNHPLMSISGQEFIGIPLAARRPVWIVAPPFVQSLGSAKVREILDWCFDPGHELLLYDDPPKTTVQRAWDELAVDADDRRTKDGNESV
jgi:hypothetical protein